MYKVFYNDRAILLAGNAEDIPRNFQKEQVQNKQELFAFLDGYFSIQPVYDLAIVGYNVSAMMDDFTAYFRFIKAAGGLVKNSDDKFLFIKRWGIWDLPKGKVEKNESLERAAIREVEEETQCILYLLIIQLRCRHVSCLPIYNEGSMFLKQHFMVFYVTDDINSPIPQENEGITDAVWLDREQSKKALSNSYRSLKETIMHHLY